LEKYMESIGLDLNVVLSRNLPGGTKKNHEKPSVKADNPAEIQTVHLSNACLERYHWTKLSGSLVTSQSHDGSTIPK
jgi:hypothetical protein